MWVEGSVKKHFQRNNRPESWQSNKFYTHLGLHKLFHPTILDGRTWRGSWENTENTENMEKMENINHMTWQDKTLYCGFWSNRTLLYFPLSACPSSIRHRRDISTFLDNLMAYTLKTIYFLSAYHLGWSSWPPWPPGSPELNQTTWTTLATRRWRKRKRKRVDKSLVQIWKLKFGHKIKILSRLSAQGLVKILKFNLRHDFKPKFGQFCLFNYPFAKDIIFLRWYIAWF